MGKGGPGRGCWKMTVASFQANQSLVRERKYVHHHIPVITQYVLTLSWESLEGEAFSG